MSPMWIYTLFFFLFPLTIWMVTEDTSKQRKQLRQIDGLCQHAKEWRNGKEMAKRRLGASLNSQGNKHCWKTIRVKVKSNKVLLPLLKSLTLVIPTLLNIILLIWPLISVPITQRRVVQIIHLLAVKHCFKTTSSTCPYTPTFEKNLKSEKKDESTLIREY